MPFFDHKIKSFREGVFAVLGFFLVLGAVAFIAEWISFHFGARP